MQVTTKYISKEKRVLLELRLVPFGCADDTGLFYGIKFYNDLLKEAWPEGNVQSELILEKNANTFTFKEGWGFPRKVYFNGDECMMPQPDEFPGLPNAAHTNLITVPKLALFWLLMFLALP